MNALFVHPFGNSFAYHAALALHENRYLAQFHTCLFNPLHSGLRYLPALHDAPIRLHPGWEVLRLGTTRLPFGNHTGRSQAFVDFVGSRCEREASREISRNVDVVYGYEDFAFHCFRRATELKVKSIYDLPIGFHSSARQFLQTEVTREPQLRPYLQSLHESDKKLYRKDAEIQMADHIICASSFTASTLPRFVKPSTKVSVIPYGVEIVGEPKRWKRVEHQGVLKLLFVGRLDPRKGLHILFEALASLPRKSYRLALAGRWIPGFQRYLQQRYSIDYEELGQVPNRALLSRYSSYDLLVFPSLFEGFGLVLLEAMAAGIPVLTTERTAGPDLLKEGGGFLVPAGDPDALRNKIENLLSERCQIEFAGHAARKVAERLSWSHYRRRFIAELTSRQ